MFYQRNENRWQRILIIALLAVSSILLVTTMISIRQTQEAKQHALTALARQLAAQAQNLSVANNPQPEIALLLAIQSMHLASSGEAAQIVLESPLNHPAPLVIIGEPVNVIAFSSDGKYVAAGSPDGTLRVLEINTEQEVFRNAQDGNTTSLCFSPNGKYLVSSTRGEIISVHVWEITTGEEIVHLQYEDPLNYVRSVVISPDSRYMVPLLGHDNTVAILELVTGKEVARVAFPLHEEVLPVMFSPDGKYLAAAAGNQVDDFTARVWEVPAGKEVSRMIHGGSIGSVVFSPDGKYVVSASGDFTARVWETLTGIEIARMTHDSYVYDAVFSPDGKFVASGGYDGTLRVWEATTGKENSRMPLENYLQTVAFSPDGKYLLTTQGGNIVPIAQVWEVATGKEIARVRRVDILKIAFSIDGMSLVSVSADGSPLVWQYLPEKLITEACSSAPRNLTHFEWEKFIGNALPYQAVCPNLPIELTPAPLINTTPTPYPTSTPF
jgi:WD40 repeat protein